MNEINQEKKKPSSIQNMNKARDIRLQRIQEKKEKEELERYELLLKKKAEGKIKTDDTNITKAKEEAITKVKEEAIKIPSKKYQTPIDSDDSSSDSSDDEIIYVPSKKKSKKKEIAKLEEKSELEMLKKKLQDLEDQQKQRNLPTTSTPVKAELPSKPETKTETTPSLPKTENKPAGLSTKYDINDPMIKEMLKYKILSF